MKWEDRITMSPDVLVGKAVIKGTRISVEHIVDLLADGWAESEILRNYPGLTHDDIGACLKFAAEVLKSERIYPFEVSKA